MGTTQPIRNKTDVKNFMAYYERIKPNPRNHAMIVLGLHTALRISDILNLQWHSLYQFDRQTYVEHLLVYEKKTGKPSLIALNHPVIAALEAYRIKRLPKPHDYIIFFQKVPILPNLFAVRRRTASSKKLPLRHCMKRISAAILCARPSVTMHGNRALLPSF